MLTPEESAALLLSIKVAAWCMVIGLLPGIAIAWLLRHPAHMQPIVGTTNPSRVRDICKASDVRLTREEWYAIYLAAGNTLP